MESPTVWAEGSCPDMLGGGHLSTVILAMDSSQDTRTGPSKLLDTSRSRENMLIRLTHSAADATSHLFFAYLRSLSPDSLRGANGIAALPISLQTLVQATEYPPERPTLLQKSSTKVIMIVDTVSPTPFALLRRAKNFQYRDSDHALQEFSNYDDPVRALTDECRRVLKCISSANQAEVSTSKASTSLRDASWSRFEDIGFGGTIDESDTEEGAEGNGQAQNNAPAPTGLRSAPHSHAPDLGRPTTPSWADFMSSGFTDENGVRNPAPLLLPPDKVLPPISTVRGQSSQSHKRMVGAPGGDDESTLEPGELASITALDLDDSFWWVWLTSLAGEEPTLRKAAFGRCALVETVITGGRWLVMEEQVKGAAPEPEAGAYIAEKKSFFGFTTRGGKLTRRKSSTKKMKTLEEPYKKGNNPAPSSKTSIGPDQHARIQAAAAALQKKHKEQEREEETGRSGPRADEGVSNKTNSVLTLQPTIMNEASPAMKWASNYDKDAVRAAYLSNSRAGTGAPAEAIAPTANGQAQAGSAERDLPATPQGESQVTRDRAISPAAPPLPSADKPQATETEKKTASDAAAVPLPESTPVKPVEKVKSAAVEIKDEAEPKQSIDSAEDGSAKKLKKKPGNTGLKGIFGKKKTEQPPLKPTGAETTSVAAARAALEGRTAQVAQETSSSLKPSGSTRLSGFRRKPVGESSAAEETKPATPPKTEAPQPVAAPVQAPAPAPAPARVSPTSPPDQYDGPPQTYRGDNDELSRVNTAERAQADREFSSFDQGPLVEQPAFVPDDTPTTESFPKAAAAPPLTEHPAARQSENGNDANGASLTDEPVPVQDRWAQIRKNAAERANQTSAGGDEPQGRTSQAERTDDGETSGEESKLQLDSL